MVTEYIAHFGMRETPFARNHNPRWLYLTMQHKEAILKTRWTFQEHGGLVLWRGDVGHGKSSLIEYALTVWPQQFGWRCAKLHNTGTINSPRALVCEILTAFGLEPAGTTRQMVARLEEWLLNQAIHDQTVVLIIDEAQSIGSRAFPVIRDLLNLQTQDCILLQMVLVGQLKIDKRLERFPALRSRIASVSTLEPLSFEECDAMLLHRFDVAGASDPLNLCTARALCALYRYSAGVPREFITIAEAAMREAFLRDDHQVDVWHVEQAVRSLIGRMDALPNGSDGAFPGARPRTTGSAVVAALQPEPPYSEALT